MDLKQLSNNVDARITDTPTTREKETIWINNMREVHIYMDCSNLISTLFSKHPSSLPGTPFSTTCINIFIGKAKANTDIQFNLINLL